MKNSKKLLAFVLAFAMVMSVMVVPVSAADVPAAPQNLMVSDSYDWSFESADGKHYGGTPNKVTASVVTPEEGDTLQPTDGDSYLMLTYNTGNTGGGHIQLQAVGKTFLKNGNYVVSVDAALAPGSAGDGTAKINVGGQSATTSTISVTPGEGCNSNVALNSNSFTTISGLFTVGPGAGTAGNNGMFITISVPQGNNLYIDNVCVKEYLPPMTATVAGVEEGVKVDPRNALTLTYTFSNAPYEFTAANVEVTPAAGVSVGAVTGDDEAGYTATVTLSNLATNANYTVALANVQDMHAKAAESTISFATNGPTAFENLLAADYNAGFETDSTKDFGYYESNANLPATRELTTPTAENGLLNPVEGDSYLKFTGRDSYNDRIEFDGVGAASKSVQLEAGKEYEVSYYAATVNAGETATAAVKVDSKNATSGNTIIVEGTDNSVQGENVTITSDKFTKVSAIVTIIENPAQNKTSNLGVKIYSRIEPTKSIYIDDFCVKEYDPMTATVAGVTEGAEVDARNALELTYTFSNAPYVFAPSNVVVTPAGADVAVAGSGTEYTVTLSNLATNANYTVALANVQDMYAQAAEAEVSFTTTGPAAFQNILKTDGFFDWSFESNDSSKHYSASGDVATEVVTPEPTDALQPTDGASYLKITNTGTSLGYIQLRGVGAADIQAKKQYMVSFDAALAPGSTGTTTKVNASRYGSNNTIDVTNAGGLDTYVTINANEFTTISGLFDVVAGTGTSATGITVAIYAPAGAIIYIDNVCVKEYDPMTVSVSGVAEGTEVDPAAPLALTYTFSNAPYEFAAENVVVTPAADVAVTGSGAAYTVTLTNLAKGTDYTVTLTGVQDMYEQAATSTYTFATSDFYLKTKNIAAGVTPTTSTGTIATVDGVTTVTKDSAGNAFWKVPFVSGKRYIFTASVNSENIGQWVGVKAAVAADNASKHYYTPSLPYTAPGVYFRAADVWYEVYNVIANAAVCDCADPEACAHNDQTVGANVGINTSSTTKSFSAKDVAVRELKALNIDGSCYGTIVTNGGAARLYLEAPGKTKVYFAAVSMVGGKAADIQFVAADLTEGFPVAALDLAIGDTYKIMVWDGNFAPLCNAFLGSEI